MVELVFSFLFWFSLGVVVYTYFGYPAVLFVVNIFFKRPVKKAASEPSVSVVISAFNEESAIEQKLLNLLELDYPEEKLEVLVGSDGASDRTDEIVSKFHSTRIRFFRFVENFGKPQVLSALVEEARGEVLLFTDARQEFDQGTIRALVANFEDPEVGCVSGELYFKMTPKNSGSVAGGMDAYWRYEKFLRKKESGIGSMLGATGAVYAVRKNLFPKSLPADILVDDMYIPFEVIAKGYRAVFESEARAYDQVSEQSAQEFKRKVRTLAGNYQVFTHFPGLFVPLKSPVAWQLFSHKFLRLMIPFLMILLFVSNLLLLGNPFYLGIFILQVLFYGLAFVETKRLKVGGRKGLGYIPYMFCLLNYSALVAFVRFIKGKQDVVWERAYA